MKVRGDGGGQIAGAALLRQKLGRKLTREEAAALHESGWWRALRFAEAALLQLHQEHLMMPIGLFHLGVAELLGRPVRFHELGDLAGLRLEAERRGGAANRTLH